MKQDKLNFFIPLEIEKSKEKERGEKMMIKGIASTNDEDADQEILEPSGFDLSYLKRYGFLNWHHQAKNSPAAVIGEPTKAEVTPKGLYIEGELYKDSKLARDVYQLASILEKSSSTRRLGFSIEGNVLERGSEDENHPDYKKIKRAIITGVAITHLPKNNNTLLSIMKGQYEEPFVEYEYDLEKAEDSSPFLLDIIDDELDQRVIVEKDLSLRIEKAGRKSKVIGHTKSGKPIYDIASHPSHRNFTLDEHDEAIALHNELMKVDKDNEAVHRDQIDNHKALKKESEEKRVEKTLDSANSGQIVREDLEGSVHNVSGEDKKKKEHALVVIAKAVKSGQISGDELDRIRPEIEKAMRCH